MIFDGPDAAALQDILLRNLHLDLTRATEQTAIILSLLQGKGIQSRGVTKEELRAARYSKSIDFPAPKREYIKELALRSVLGFLQKALCKGQIPECFKFEDFKCWEQLSAKDFFGQLGYRGDIDEYEFVTSPLDGSEALSNGQAGVASVLAGGPKGTFHDPSTTNSPDDERFLVATVSPTVGSSTAEFIKHRTNREVPVCELVGDLVHHCVEAASMERHELAVSFMQDDGKPATREEQAKGKSSSRQRRSRRIKELPHLLRMLCRTRRQTGSRVLAALSPFIPELQIAAFIDEVSLVQASIIAAGASATRGYFLACPLKGKSLSDELPVMSTSDFVADNDVFVLATGVTDSIVMKGTRFLGNDRAYTESLLLRKATQSRRVVNTNHDQLSDRTFRFLGSEEERELKYGAKLFELIRDELKPPSKRRRPRRSSASPRSAAD